MANIKHNFVYNFLLSCSQVIIPLISIPYISRVLTPDGIGVVGYFDSLTFYMVALAEVGITVYGMREIAKLQNEPQALRRLVSELLSLHIFVSIFVVAGYVIALLIMHQNSGHQELVYLSIAFLIANSFTCEWYFLGMEKVKFISIRTFIIRMLGLLAMFIFIKKPAHYTVYYYIIVATAVAGFMVNFVALAKQIGFSFTTKNLKRHIPFLRNTYLISILYSIPLFLDTVLLKFVSSAVFVGYYSFSVKLLRTAVNVITDSFYVFMPRVASLSHAGDTSLMQSKLNLNLQFIILLSVPMGVGLYLISDDLAVVFYGDQFKSLALNFKILSVFPFLKSLSLFYSNPILIARNKEAAFLKNLCVSSFVFVLLALIFGKYFQDIGICIVIIIIEILLIGLNLSSISKAFSDIKIFQTKTFFEALIGAGLFIPVYFFINYLIENSLIRLGVIMFFSMLAYGSFMWMFSKSDFVVSFKNSVSSYFKRRQNLL